MIVGRPGKRRRVKFGLAVGSIYPAGSGYCICWYLVFVHIHLNCVFLLLVWSVRPKRPALLSHALCEPCCLSFAQPSFDLFRDNIQRRNRITPAVRNDHVVARNFIVDYDVKSICGFSCWFFAKLNPYPERTRRVLPHAPDLADNRILQILRYVETVGPRENAQLAILEGMKADVPEARSPSVQSE